MGLVLGEDYVILASPGTFLLIDPLDHNIFDLSLVRFGYEHPCRNSVVKVLDHLGIYTSVVGKDYFGFDTHSCYLSIFPDPKHFCLLHILPDHVRLIDPGFYFYSADTYPQFGGWYQIRYFSSLKETFLFINTKHALTWIVKPFQYYASCFGIDEDSFILVSNKARNEEPRTTLLSYVQAAKDAIKAEVYEIPTYAGFMLESLNNSLLFLEPPMKKSKVVVINRKISQSFIIDSPHNEYLNMLIKAKHPSFDFRFMGLNPFDTKLVIYDDGSVISLTVKDDRILIGSNLQPSWSNASQYGRIIGIGYCNKKDADYMLEIAGSPIQLNPVSEASSFSSVPVTYRTWSVDQFLKGPRTVI